MRNARLVCDVLGTNRQRTKGSFVKNKHISSILTESRAFVKKNRKVGNEMAVLHITKENFENEVLKSEVPVLVDFWATWCGPCQMMLPVVEQLAEELEGVKIGKINVDEEEELAERYQVMSIPNFIVFKNGQVTANIVGGRSKEELKKLLL